MSYNAKNYTEQGGAVTHIGGKVVFDATGAVDGLPGATATKNGGVKLAANQADSTAADAAALKADFNALLAKLKAAGVMAADAT